MKFVFRLLSCRLELPPFPLFHLPFSFWHLSVPFSHPIVRVGNISEGLAAENHCEVSADLSWLILFSKLLRINSSPLFVRLNVSV